MKHTFLLLVAFTMFFASCKKDEVITAHPETQKITNLHAPADVRDQQTGEIIQENPYIYFSFAKADTVPQTESWDIAFKGTKIITNSGVSGSGNAKATIIASTFDDVLEANDADLAIDTDTQLAIPYGSDNGWYHYNPTNHLITPIAGRVIVVKTNDGKYAKMEILSYYKDAPADPTPTTQDATLTFNFVYQGDGTNKF